MPTSPALSLIPQGVSSGGNRSSYVIVSGEFLSFPQYPYFCTGAAPFSGTHGARTGALFLTGGDEMPLDQDSHETFPIPKPHFPCSAHETWLTSKNLLFSQTPATGLFSFTAHLLTVGPICLVS